MSAPLISYQKTRELTTAALLAPGTRLSFNSLKQEVERRAKNGVVDDLVLEEVLKDLKGEDKVSYGSKRAIHWKP